MVAEQLNDPQPGHWMFRHCRYCPEVPARIFWNDEEPGEPGNKLDQPFLDALIALDHVPPMLVWTGRRRVVSPAEYGHQIELLRWAERNQPNDPRLDWKRPVDRDAIPLPLFGATA
jgi:hypothetical protein